MKIKIWQDPYDEGFATTNCEELELIPGVSVLVGCNGSGKSTLIKNISSQCKEDDTPYLKYDDRDDAHTLKYRGLEDEDYGFIATTMQSSEGETLKANLGKIAHSMYEFLTTGMTSTSKLEKAFAALFTSEDKKKIESNKRVILLDAVESGMSIDNVLELKKFFELVIKDAERLNLELYIVVSANEYELANGSNCIDVTTGNYITFNNYDEFRSFILDTRELKDNRCEEDDANGR